MMRLAGCVFIGAALLALTPAVGSGAGQDDSREPGRRAHFQRRRSRRALRDRLGPGHRRHLRCQRPHRRSSSSTPTAGSTSRTTFRFSRGDPILGQPQDPPAGLQPRREPDAGRERGSPLYRRRPWLVPPQRRDHGVRRQRRHLRSLLVRLRHVPSRATSSDRAAAGTSGSTSAAASGSASVSRPSSSSRCGITTWPDRRFQTATPMPARQERAATRTAGTTR